jgi:hypothetical protein
MLKTTRFALGAALLGLVGAAACAGHPDQPLPCEPGYTIVEETCYKEVIHKVCRQVPDVKKTVKTVYSCKEDDVCLPRCHGAGGHKHEHGEACGEGCEECGGTAKVRTRRLLVKRFVTEECPSTKWVVESVVERVPYKVYHKVPCAAAGAACPAPPHADLPPAERLAVPPREAEPSPLPPLK